MISAFLRKSLGCWLLLCGFHQPINAQEILSAEEMKKWRCITKAVDRKVLALKRHKVDSTVVIYRGYSPEYLAEGKVTRSRIVDRVKHVLWKTGGRCYLQAYRDCGESALREVNSHVLDSLISSFAQIEQMPHLQELKLHDSRGYEFFFYIRAISGVYIIHDYQLKQLALNDPRKLWLQWVDNLIKE